uniref:Short-chain dehydrogenase/reductase SDR n=1 Tax=Ganoderma boninense TaxID=34458 RepID=A0A5K1K472_9APHY|nr:Short-chain dehydrogenase/reductase SDR [Ganoderma boninense]
MSAFGLLANSYIEFYNPDARAWEKEKLCAVRSVESQQRVLFRVCRSIIDGLEDSECPGIDAEIRLQEESRCTPAIPLLYHPMDTTSPRKRPADELLTQPLSKHHRARSTQSSVLLHPSTNTTENSPALPKPAERRCEDHIEIETPVVQPPSPSPTSSPSVSVSAITPALMSTPSTSEVRPRQLSHYVPHTPISPMHYAPSNFGPMATLQQRANIPISTESSLAMAVTPPTHTLPLQRSPQAPARANLHPTPNPNPTPSPTPSSTSLPSSSRLLAPNPSGVDRSPTPASAVSTTQGTSSGAGTGGAGGKAWPHGKYVCEVHAGFAAMEETMARDATVKQPEAFRRAFGVPHKKSTVCSHKKVWKSAPQDVLAEWRARGREDGALWSEFVRTVEGKDAKRAGVGTGMGGGGGGGAAAADGAGVAAAAFGSPQGGVLQLGPGPRTVPTPAAAVAAMGVQGLGMTSLRQPQPPFFGEQQYR